MTKGAYYSENDPFAAAWLRALIFFGHIAPGDVDERSIEDVCPDDLRGYAQHHFFAGIGVWSHVLRSTGWPDDRPVWTASCPCQPFSQAGQGGGFADERHLWPALYWLVLQLGEQVASKNGLTWLDLVSSDLENAGYAFGAVDLCAAGFGAPHIRQRSYWCALDNNNSGRHRTAIKTLCSGRSGSELSGRTGGALVDAPGEQEGLSGRTREPGRTGALAYHQRRDRIGAQPEQGGCSIASNNRILGDDDDDARLQVRPFPAVEQGTLRIEGTTLGETGLVRGRWAGADWIFCRDGKWRPVEPGALPLAHGAPARVGRLRGYGNALCAPVAQGFIEAVIDALS